MKRNKWKRVYSSVLAFLLCMSTIAANLTMVYAAEPDSALTGAPPGEEMLPQQSEPAASETPSIQDTPQDTQPVTPPVTAEPQPNTDSTSNLPSNGSAVQNPDADRNQNQTPDPDNAGITQTTPQHSQQQESLPVQDLGGNQNNQQNEAGTDNTDNVNQGALSGNSSVSGGTISSNTSTASGADTTGNSSSTVKRPQSKFSVLPNAADPVSRIKSNNSLLNRNSAAASSVSAGTGTRARQSVRNAAPVSNGLSGSTMLSNTIDASQPSAREGANTGDGNINIKDGNIIIKSGSYIVGGIEYINLTNRYTIYGDAVAGGGLASTGNTITVESGTPDITLRDFEINVTNIDEMPAISIKSGTNVNLSIANSVVLKSGQYAAGLQIESGAMVTLGGTGSLTAIAGLYGPGIGGYNTSKGGSMKVIPDSDNLQILAYSTATSRAIDLSYLSSEMGIAQGSLKAAPSTNTAITLENVDTKSKTEFTMPAGYFSFAVSTSMNPGKYVAYMNDNIARHELLETDAGKSVFNLKDSKFASLEALSSKIVTYRAAFYAQGGAFSNGQNSTYKDKIYYDNKITKPEDPTRTEYVFEGWFTDSDYINEWDFENDTITQDTSLYAKWHPVNCTVNFRTNVPNNTIPSMTVSYNSTIPASVVSGVQNNGTDLKTLDGWYANGSTERWVFDGPDADGPPTPVLDHVTLSAKWLSSFKVTFNLNPPSGKTADGQPEQATVLEGNTVTEPSVIPTCPDYDFRGWYTDKAGTNPWDFTHDKVTRALTLFAKWTPQYCTVKFDTAGGSTIEPAVIKYDELITRPVDPTMDARPAPNPTTYTFDGWYTDKGELWDFTSQTVTQDMTLKARWHQNTVYVIYVHNNGTGESSTISHDYGFHNGAPDITPEKEGYEVRNWLQSNNKPWNFDTPFTEDITLTAQWGIKTYNVTFDTGEDSGVFVPNQRVEFDKKVTKPTDPIRPGYVFSGWYSTEDYQDGTLWSFDTPMPANDITLYAYWMPISYTITFDSDGGSPVVDTKTYHYTDAIDKPEDPVKDHYNFGGWYKDPQKSIAWDFDANKVSNGILTDNIENKTGSMTLYAKWVPEVYTVTFHTDTENGEPALPTELTKQSVTYKEFASLPAYPSTPWNGYTLQGWYTKTEEGAFDQKWEFADSETPTSVERNLDLYANWTQDEYTITYVTNAPEEEIPSMLPLTPRYYGDKLTAEELPRLTREHYNFDNWFKDEEFTTPWDMDADEITGNTTLYAHWIPKDYTFTFQITDENGMSSTSTVAPVTQPYGTFLTEPEVAPRPGFTFHSWYKDAALTPEEQWNFTENPVDQNRTLYASWTRDIYTVHFETYGGTPVPEDQLLEYEDTAIEPETPPARPHYSFGGWFHESTFDNEWDFTNDKITGHTTIYAKWIPDIYKVTFEVNGGKKLEPLDVTYGNPIGTEYPVTTRDGYHMLNWCTDPELTLPFDVANTLVEQDMTLYANWELDEYSLVYDFGDGTKEKDEKIYHYGDHVKNPGFTKEHMTLNGWYKDSAYTDKWVFKRDTIKENTTLYGYWTDTEYNLHFETYDGTEIPDETANWGDVVTKPEVDPVRDGHTFNGWFKDAACTTAWDFEEDFIEGNTIIYSGWIPDIHTITIDLGEDVAPLVLQIEYGQLIPRPEDPEKEGYKFLGWSAVKTSKARAAAQLWNFDTDTVTEDITLVTQWEEIKEPTVSGNDPTNPEDPKNPDDPEDPTIPVDPADPTNPNTPTDPTNPTTDNGQNTTTPTSTTTGTNNSGTNNSGTNNSGTNNSDTNKGSGTTGTVSTNGVGSALRSAANTVKEIATGDNAPLILWITLIVISAGAAIFLIVKKSK